MAAKHNEVVAPPLNDPMVSARAAGLRYTRDDRPGLRRLRSGKGFRYLDSAGRARNGRRHRQDQAGKKQGAAIHVG